MNLMLMFSGFGSRELGVLRGKVAIALALLYVYALFVCMYAMYGFMFACMHAFMHAVYVVHVVDACLVWHVFLHAMHVCVHGMYDACAACIQCMRCMYVMHVV